MGIFYGNMSTTTYINTYITVIHITYITVILHCPYQGVSQNGNELADVILKHKVQVFFGLNHSK